MKKITSITVSILALAAATVAAQTSDHTTVFYQPEVEVNSLSVEALPLRGATSEDTAQSQAATSDIRFVTMPEIKIKSCDTAAWPYYPAKCLQRVEMSSL